MQCPGRTRTFHLPQNLPLPLTGCALAGDLAPHPDLSFSCRGGVPLPSPLGCGEGDSSGKVTAHSRHLTNGRCPPLVTQSEGGCHMGDVLCASLGTADPPWSGHPPNCLQTLLVWAAPSGWTEHVPPCSPRPSYSEPLSGFYT